MLEVLRELLAEGRTEDAVALVARLVARNSELERQLAEAKTKAKKSEGVSRAQLLLLLDGACPRTATAASPRRTRSCASPLASTSSRRKRSGRRNARTGKRRPLPASLRRVDNPIAVPADQRACPACGAERQCIGHDVTEVIDLIPAEVIVRRDVREKLACRPCEGQLVRAPLGDKVVAGGRMGIVLVAQLLVDKYDDGLPLSRQARRFERARAGTSPSRRWRTRWPGPPRC